MCAEIKNRQDSMSDIRISTSDIEISTSDLVFSMSDIDRRSEQSFNRCPKGLMSKVPEYEIIFYECDKQL